MSASILMVVAIGCLSAGYVFYGRFLTRKFDLNANRKTPAHTKNDGVDYVPTKKPVLMGHHFASIAGAAPIIGPIMAAVFGWVPVLLWILIGSIFLGGTHDFSALVASIRHGGKTMGEVIEEHIGEAGKRLFLAFAWFLIVLVIAVFAHAVANVFVKEPATATASGLFILVALVFGMSVYRYKTPLWLSSIIGVALLVGCIAFGVRYPFELSYNTWKLVAGTIGIFAANPRIESPAFTTFNVEGKGLLFPMLFVLVACGAISGFHSLVSAGTTAKQLNKETDAKPVCYGSMLIEGLLAVMALITATTILKSDYSNLMAEGGPIAVFSSGIGSLVSHLGIPEKAGVTFAALAISAFALTTLDTATRLGRFMFQEFFEGTAAQPIFSENRYAGTVATIVVAMLFTFTGTRDALWPLFGSANQLLASLTLLAITVWLAKKGRRTGFVRYPMYFMFCVTLTALGLMAYNNIRDRNVILIIMSVLLLAVAVTLVAKAAGSLKSITKKVGSEAS